MRDTKESGLICRGWEKERLEKKDMRKVSQINRVYQLFFIPWIHTPFFFIA